MKNNIALRLIISGSFLLLPFVEGCDSSDKQSNMSKSVNILFLHHSTGRIIMRGSTSRVAYKLGLKGGIEKHLAQYNKRNGTQYNFQSQAFPQDEPYGHKNYPYDYYNIWVRHAGNKPYMEEPTLEILTATYNVIIFKHCFPVSNIVDSGGVADINAEVKTLENYKLQYNALKDKMHSFPDTRFILWTGAAQLKEMTTEEEAKRAKAFFKWVVNEWDEIGDNIFLWDFRGLETNGDLYMRNEFASGSTDSHPNKKFASFSEPLLTRRIIDVIEGRGDSGSLTGER
jgi:hypothetical protein